MVMRPQLLGFGRDLGVVVRFVAGWSGALAVKEEKTRRRRRKKMDEMATWKKKKMKRRVRFHFFSMHRESRRLVVGGIKIRITFLFFCYSIFLGQTHK
jgi:hypothetical protein